MLEEGRLLGRRLKEQDFPASNDGRNIARCGEGATGLDLLSFLEEAIGTLGAGVVTIGSVDVSSMAKE